MTALKIVRRPIRFNYTAHRIGFSINLSIRCAENVYKKLDRRVSVPFLNTRNTCVVCGVGFVVVVFCNRSFEGCEGAERNMCKGMMCG